MAGYSIFSTNSILTNGNEILSVLGDKLTAAGWTQGGTTWTYSAGGRTSTVNLNTTAWTSGGYAQMTLNGMTYYFPVWSSPVGAQVYWDFAVSTDLFYFSMRGPSSGTTGAKDATYGSPRAFVCLTTIDPYDTVADADADALQVVFGSHIGTSSPYIPNSHTVVQKKDIAGNSNRSAELLCTRPAVQDVTSIGDAPPSNKMLTGYFGSKYILVDQIYGVRGELNNIAFGCENYQLGDDPALPFPVNTVYTAYGNKYYTSCLPAGGYNAANVPGYHPLGRTTAAAVNVNNNSGATEGPRIFVRKGDG